MGLFGRRTGEPSPSPSDSEQLELSPSGLNVGISMGSNPVGAGGDGEDGDGGDGGGEPSMSLSDADIRSAPTGGGGGPCGCTRKRCLCLSGAAALLALALGLALGLTGHLPPVGGPPTHRAYTARSASAVDEYRADLIAYRHESTKAEFLAMIPRKYAGEDKAFGIAFRTVPTDDTGVAHILEHSVLSGSRKYPVKDPFLHLLKGSLQTFLNAMTYNDRTVYPVASRNRQDFRNLMDVYLDAVFHPRCLEEEWVLKQEGWRYEVNDDDELELRGVVMSEMMGAYSDPDEVMYRTSESLLFPDTVYRFDSGGKPSDIPNLTFDAFREFYRAHYHPTNSKTFVYGDYGDVRDALKLFDEYMSEYTHGPAARSNSVVPYQSMRFSAPVRERRPYASNDEDDGGGGSMLRIHWLLQDESLPALTELALVVLDDLLLGSPSATLRKALLESGLGEEVIEDGLEDEHLQSTYAVGMKGIKGEEDVKKVEDLIMSTLDSIANEGFEADDIEASVNTVEFDLREFNSGNDPKSITAFLRIMSKWNYDLDPGSALVFEQTLGELKEEIHMNGSQIFQGLVRTYLLANSHRVVLEFYPSATYEEDQIKEEKERLASIKASLSPDQLQKIKDDAKALEDLQSADDPPEAIASIPTLSLRDLDRTNVEYPIHVTEGAFHSGVTLVTHAVPSSSGIAYVDFGMDISDIPYEDVALLPFFNRMMMETGTSALTDRQLDQQIGMHTGGIEFTSFVENVNPEGVGDVVVVPGDNMRTIAFLRGKCTPDKAPKLFELYSMILSDANLDSQQKAVQILQEMASDLRTDIPSSGSSYVLTRIRSRYTVRGFVHEQTGGVTRVGVTKFLLDHARSDWPLLLKRLERMRRIMLGGSRGGMVLNLTGDGNVMIAVDAYVRDFLTNAVPSLPGAQNDTAKPPPDFRSTPHPWIGPAKSAMSTSAPVRDEMIVAPTKVSYVGVGGLMYDVGSPVPGSAAVVSRYLQNGYLWETVRVKNGAYGAWAGLTASEGSFAMVSYRDPELGVTLEAFHGAADELLGDVSSGALTERDGDLLTKAIIGAIGHLDGSAAPPDEVGWVSLSRWLRGSTVGGRQKWRDEILGTGVEDFEDFARRLGGWAGASVAVVGSRGAYDEYSAESGSVPLEIIETI